MIWAIIFSVFVVIAFGNYWWFVRPLCRRLVEAERRIASLLIAQESLEDLLEKMSDRMNKEAQTANEIFEAAVGAISQMSITIGNLAAQVNNRGGEESSAMN